MEFHFLCLFHPLTERPPKIIADDDDDDDNDDNDDDDNDNDDNDDDDDNEKKSSRKFLILSFDLSRFFLTVLGSRLCRSHKFSVSPSVFLPHKFFCSLKFSVCPSVFLSVCLSFRLSVCLPHCLSIYISWPFVAHTSSLSVYLFFLPID